MAYLGGGFTSAVAAAGNAILSGKELQVRDDEIQLQKQQVAMGQLALANAQRQQQTQATVGAFLSSEAAKDNSAFTDPAKSAQLYEKAAGLALQGGDFVSANEMGDLAKGKMQEAKEQLVVAAQQKHQKQEDLASTADDYATNPTADGAKELMRKAIDAGVNPTAIPMPGTPQWGTWVNQQKQAAMDSKSRMELAERANEFTQRQQQQKEEFQQRQQDLQENRRQTAILRESMQSIDRERLDLEKQKLEAGGTKGKQMSMRAADQANAVVGNAAEAVRNIDVMSEMKIGTSNTPFSEIHGGTYLDAIAKAGTAAFTPVNTQLLASAQGGLVAELTNINVVGPGTRGPTQARIAEMHRALDFQAGSPPIVNLFKFANAADIARVRLKATPDELLTPEAKASKQEQLDILSKIPTPKQVYKAAQNSPYAEQINQSQASITDVSRDLVNMSKPATESGTGLPGGTDAGAGTTAPPLPSGWSVKEH